MASSLFEGIKISGLACAVPKGVDHIQDYADCFEVDKFIATTGVKERRRLAEGQTCGDLCYEAAEKLIAYKGFEKSSFDGIVLITQTADYVTPATAHILHMRLGLSKDCMAFDINLGCSGFVYGLSIISALIVSGTLKRVLMCCGEAPHRLMPKNDPAQSMLFGAAGSAIIIEKAACNSDNNEGCSTNLVRTLLKADGTGYQAIILPGVNARVGLDWQNPCIERIQQKMDGAMVFEFAISQVPRAFKEFFSMFDVNIDEYDYCIFHQANLFLIEHIRKKIKLPKEKMPVSMDRYGNTSSASIPLTIADLCQRNDVKDTLHFISSGFGIGLSWGVADFFIERKDILPIIETDEYFRDAYVGL